MSDQADGLRRLASETGVSGSTRIITIVSGKGGVGKSNIAINLGIALSEMKKRVVVIDADLGLANINVLLGVIPKFNLFNVLNDGMELKDIIIEVPEGIGIIAGASGFSQLADLDVEKRKEFIKKLKELDNRDYVIIDASPGVSKNVLGFTIAADEAAIVTTPEPTSITDAYGIIKAISCYEKIPELSIIINRVSSIIEGKKIADRIISITNQFLNIKIKSLGYIFEDISVSKAVFKQEPFIKRFPKSKVSNCMRNMASFLENRPISTKRKGFTDFVRKFLKVQK